MTSVRSGSSATTPARPNARAVRRTQAQRAADSAQRLRDALAELIAEQGYERTTVAQIGARAGLSKAMVRERYGSKEALLEAMHRDYEALLLAPDTDEPSGLQRLLAGVARLQQMASQRPVWLRAVFIVSFEAPGTITHLRPTIQRWLTDLHAAVTTWITQGQQDGSVRTELDPASEADHFFNDAIGGAYRWTLNPDSIDYPAHLETWQHQLARRYSPNQP